MATIKLTPMQVYLLNAYQVLIASVDNTDKLNALLARPETLKSAISAAFYKSVGHNIKYFI